LQGQQWITLEKLQQTHRNTLFQEGNGIWGIQTVPDFGIGQRALLVRTGNGNILWDCISLINPDTIALVNGLGGISAIAISHPHYYTSMVEWSRAFAACQSTCMKMIIKGCSVLILDQILARGDTQLGTWTDIDPRGWAFPRLPSAAFR
jgi:hypothetical protein